LILGLDRPDAAGVRGRTATETFIVNARAVDMRPQCSVMLDVDDLEAALAELDRSDVETEGENT
jgi:hypothetical protein